MGSAEPWRLLRRDGVRLACRDFGGSGPAVLVAEPGWDAWERPACPALLVRSGAGVVAPELAREMVRRRAGARLVELECSAHDVHLDRPQAWRRTLSGFLECLDAQP